MNEELRKKLGIPPHFKVFSLGQTLAQSDMALAKASRDAGLSDEEMKIVKECVDKAYRDNGVE